MSGSWRIGATAAGVLALTLVGGPAVGWEGLDEDIDECFETVLGAETGLDAAVDFLTEWVEYTLDFDFELIGFAFCNPPDPWAEPDTTPIGSLNA